MPEHFLYIGSYTEVPYAPEDEENGIYLVRLKGETLEVVDARAEKNVTFFLCDRNRKKLYALSEAKPPLSALHRYDIDTETGELSDHVEVQFAESGACYLSRLREESGHYLLAIAFYDSGVVRTVHEDKKTGLLNSHPPVVFSEVSGVIPDRQEAPHPHAVVPLPTGDEFLVPDLGGDALYKLRCQNHKTRIMHEVKLPPGTGPRHVLKHPKHDLLFVLNELANTLVVYETDGLLTSLTQTDEKSSLGEIDKSFKVPNDNIQTAAHLQISKCGHYILVSNRGRHNNITVFRLSNVPEGKIELVQSVSTEGHFPRFFTLIDDRYLVVANQLSNTVLLFHFNHGRITGPISKVQIPNPAAIAVL